MVGLCFGDWCSSPEIGVMGTGHLHEHTELGEHGQSQGQAFKGQCLELPGLLEGT